MAKLFWWLLAMDTLAFCGLMVLASRGPQGPNAMVGAWLALLPPIAFAGLALAAWLWPSEKLFRTGALFLGMPWFSAIASPVQGLWDKWQSDRYSSGDRDFRGAARKVANAIAARDIERVRELLPQVSDLNSKQGDETLLLFAIENIGRVAPAGAPGPEVSREIVQLLLDSGADPNTPIHSSYYPLNSAMYRDVDLVRTLLDAGANPNLRGDNGQPLWWQLLNGSDSNYDMLTLLLDRGADVTLRTPDCGPVGLAAFHAEHDSRAPWRGVWLLVERGANWKNESCNGDTAEKLIRKTIEFRERVGYDISADMRKFAALFD